MRTSNSVRMLAGVAVTALLVAAQSQAEIAYNFTTSASLVGNQTGGPFALGTLFNVSTPIKIDQLAAFDNGANGFSVSGVNVAVYKVTLTGTAITGGTLVTPSVNFSGTAQSLLPGTDTRVASIAPVTLAAGTYMVVANHYSGTGGVYEDDYNPYYAAPGHTANGPNGASANAAFGVTFTALGGYYQSDIASFASTFNGTGGWGYDPAYTGSPKDPRYAAGNFDFTPVPEAVQFAMAGVGLLGLVYIGRHVRLARKMKLA